MTHRRWTFAAALLGAAILTMPRAAVGAQSGIVGGTVYRDTSFKDVLTGVEVTIPTLNRRTVTNYAGDFRISGLPAGKYAMVLRHVGFAPLIDTVAVADNAPVDKEYSLVAQPVSLDSVRVDAARDKPVLSARMSQFEEHRRMGLGHFITDSVLRTNEDRRLNDLITSNIPGVKSIRTGITSEYLASGRGACGGPVFQCGTSKPCPVTLYVDGVLTYSTAIAGEIPDLTRMAVRDYVGVEYYSGGATVPHEYNVTAGGCGTLVLWTRERVP